MTHVTYPSLDDSLARKIARLSVTQYEAMIDRGIIPEGEPIELLNGLLVFKDRSASGGRAMTVGPEHQLVLNKLSRLAPQVERRGCYLALQSPIRIPPTSEPEPDASIVLGKPEDYAKRHPTADEVFAVIEVADSSLLYDRNAKLRVYAGAGINQYVIVNLVDHQVEVYFSPLKSETRFKGRAIRTGAESVALALGLGRKHLTIRAKDLLP